MGDLSLSKLQILSEMLRACQVYPCKLHCSSELHRYITQSTDIRYCRQTGRKRQTNEMSYYGDKARFRAMGAVTEQVKRPHTR